MNQKNYFKQLKDELHGHPLRDRFLGELEDHAEDLENDKELKREFIESEMIKKYLGEPKEVKENFLNIMNPFRKLFFVLEGLFYGFLSIPIALIFFTVNKWQESGMPENFKTLIIGTIISIIFINLIFWSAFKRYQEIKSNIKNEANFWALLIILPGITSLTFLGFFSTNLKDVYAMEPYKVFIMLIFYGLINLGAAYLGWFFTKKGRGKKLKTKKILEFLKRAIIVYISLGIIFKIIFTYLITNEPAGWIMILGAIFRPIFLLEYMFVFFWAGMVNFSPQDEVNLLTTYYFLFFILIFLSLQSFWVILKEKKFLSLRGLIVLYVFTLFLIPNGVEIKEPDFKVPAVNISESIEKKELGIFYGLIKYFNQDEGQVFKYQVGYNDSPLVNGFIIKSNIGNSYYIGYSSLKESKPILDYEFDGLEIPTYTNLPDYYECDRKDLDNCNLSDFVDKFIAKLSVPLSSAAFSKDGKWGLISIPSGAYDPDNVYLVNLSSLDEK